MARCLVRRLTRSKSSRSEIGKAGEPGGGARGSCRERLLMMGWKGMPGDDVIGMYTIPLGGRH